MGAEGISIISGPTPSPSNAWGSAPSDHASPAKVKEIPNILRKDWQRKLLFAILAVLMLLVFLNISLTLWIITSLKLSMNKIGPLKIIKGGIELLGESYVTNTLVASKISSRPSQPISIYSSRNFSIHVIDPDTMDESTLFFNRNYLKSSGSMFDVTDTRGKSIFRATAEEVSVAANTLSVEGDGGIRVRSAVQVANVKAPPGSDLELESQTRRLDLRAPQNIQIESRAGSIDVTSHTNIELDSVVGAIKMDAQNIYLKHLREVPLTPEEELGKNEKHVKVYQLCVCASGKMFLAPPDGLCAVHQIDKDLCL